MIAGQERMLVTVRDINERKKADQRRAALYRISDAARAAQDMDDFYQPHPCSHPHADARQEFLYCAIRSGYRHAQLPLLFR